MSGEFCSKRFWPCWQPLGFTNERTSHLYSYVFERSLRQCIEIKVRINWRENGHKRAVDEVVQSSLILGFCLLSLLENFASCFEVCEVRHVMKI